MRTLTIVLLAHTLTLFASVAFAQEVRFNVRAELGGTDSDYHTCGNGVFAAAGGSAEIGRPLFLEFLAEVASIGSLDQCLPGRTRTDSVPTFVPVDTKGPSFRLGMGIGYPVIRERIVITGRVGEFFPTREPFVSGVLTGRVWVITLGLEIGQISAKWKYEDGFTDRKWTRFAGVLLGFRP